MANPEHLAILSQGVEVWNKWREEYPGEEVDLREADLRDRQLYGLNLDRTILTDADFSSSHLRVTSLVAANLERAQLRGAKIEGVALCSANLKDVDFTSASLLGANFSMTGSSLGGYTLSFKPTDLKAANFNKAELLYTDFSDALLDNTDLSYTSLNHMTFANTNLSKVKGLETIDHKGPSTIDIDTIINSHGHIPEIFLRKAGVPQSIVEQIPALIGSLSPIDYYSCFISHSSKDQGFADRLYADLQSKGVRCWFAPHDLRIGDRFADRIEESIRTYDKLLIILSKNSVRSTWVEDECRAGLEKEDRFREKQQLDKSILFPIKLDEAIKDATSQWVCKLRRERHIGDFKKWRYHDDYQQAFSRLLRDLKSGA